MDTVLRIARKGNKLSVSVAVQAGWGVVYGADSALLGPKGKIWVLALRERGVYYRLIFRPRENEQQQVSFAIMRD